MECTSWSRLEAADSLEYLLNHREIKELKNYTDEYVRRFGQNPETDPNAMFFLGDNTRFSYTWTCTSNAISTFRRQSGKFWVPRLKRWLVAIDKLTALGFPTTAEAASTLGLRQPLPVSDPSRGHSVCGNSFHLTNCAVILLLAMTCFGPAKSSG